MKNGNMRYVGAMVADARGSRGSGNTNRAVVACCLAAMCGKTAVYLTTSWLQARAAYDMAVEMFPNSERDRENLKLKVFGGYVSFRSATAEPIGLSPDLLIRD